LLSTLYAYISIENKKNEVDELAENVAILYNKELYDSKDSSIYEKIDNGTIKEIVEKIANSDVKKYKSLTKKTIFKFMDLVDM
jgi:hypothetical protein